jgi:predicted nucleic acid-binding protein
MLALVATIVIRNLDDQVAERLKIQARLKGVSLEQEARRILTDGSALTRGRSVHARRRSVLVSVRTARAPSISSGKTGLGEVSPVRAHRGRCSRAARCRLSVVVDASIAVQWFSNEPRSNLAARLIEEQTPLLAPDLMPVEAVNAWWKKVRVGDMEPSHLNEALVNLLGLGIELAPATLLLAPAARLAVEIDHPVYDCLYLALAKDRRARLATDDRDLRRAASRLEIALWDARRTQ